MKRIWMPAMLAVFVLANCTTDPTSLVSSSLATNGNLSVEAIRLQSSSERLLTLEQEQDAATKRLADFGVQGAAIGAGVGAAAGAGLACLTAKIQGRNCDTGTMVVAGAAGATAGGVYGYQKGQQVAQTQNTAASKENAIRRRLQVASQQLTTARAARQQAEAVVAQNQRKLAKLKADVAAGRATKAQLDLARSDARADAQQVKLASASLGSGANSLQSKGNVASAQSASQTAKLNANSSAMAQEKARVDAQYAALQQAIKESAL
ncbi:MAG: hypothetical protein KDA73_05645 [Rhodobacteraceae bacterium]|nr:hypothetical protein [Paracoccaceae bacterium]